MKRLTNIFKQNPNRGESKKTTISSPDAASSGLITDPRMRGLINEVSKCNKNLAESRKRLSDSEENYNRQRTRNRNIIESLNQDNAQFQSKLRDTEGILSDLQREKTALEGENKVLGERAKTRIIALRAKNNKLVERLRNSQEEISKINAETRQEINMLNEETRVKTTMIQELRAKNEELKKLKNSMENQGKKDSNAMESMKEETKQQIDRLNRKIADLEEENMQKMEKIKELILINAESEQMLNHQIGMASAYQRASKKDINDADIDNLIGGVKNKKRRRKNRSKKRRRKTKRRVKRKIKKRKTNKRRRRRSKKR